MTRNNRARKGSFEYIFESCAVWNIRASVREERTSDRPTSEPEWELKGNIPKSKEKVKKIIRSDYS
jgi:hypothetical protein